MELFLTTLLRLSVLGSVLALALTAVRRLFRGRETVCYYLWLLVLARLCVPVWVTVPLPAGLGDAPEVPEPPTAPVFQSAPEEAGDAALTAPVGLGDSAAVNTPAVTPDGFSNPFSLPDPPDLPDVPAAPDAPEPPAEPGGTVLTIACAVWGLGALTSVSWYVWGYARFSRRVRRAAVPAGADAREVLRGLDPAGRVRLLESGAVNTPLLLGLLRPVVVLPCGVTEEARLRDILAHELTHARRHDLLYKWCAALVTSLHWFNPLMVLVRREISRGCELSCDAAVLRTLDETGRKHYGETLLALAAEAPSGLGPLAVTLCEEKQQLKERLISIVRYRRAGPAAAVLAVLLAAVLCGCALIGGARVVESGTPEDGMQAEPVHAAVPDEDKDQMLNFSVFIDQDVTIYELRDGLKLAIPNDIADRLLVLQPDEAADEGEGEVCLVRVYEKQSYEESMADYGFEAGYLFSISRFTEEMHTRYMLADYLKFFAIDEKYYYAWSTASDLQVYRNGGYLIEEDWIEWEALLDRTTEIMADFVVRNGLSGEFDKIAPVAYRLEDTTAYQLPYGLTLLLPGDINKRLYVFSGAADTETIVTCYERQDYDKYGSGYGWVFSISRYTQAMYDQFLNGQPRSAPAKAFAKDGDIYYMFEFMTARKFFMGYYGDDYNDVNEAWPVWEAIYERMDDVLADFVVRNGLEPYSDEEFYAREFTYDGEHRFVAYYGGGWGRHGALTLVLSQPVRQGEGGIWCVERYNGHYLAYEMPGDAVVSSEEYYRKLQAEADAGRRPELLDPRQAALAWLQDMYREAGGMTFGPDDVVVLDEDITLLTQAELDRANAAFASMVNAADEEGNDLYTTASEISCFFTSTYSSPEELDLVQFLYNCPIGSELDDGDGEEFRGVLAELGEGGDAQLPSQYPVPVRRFLKEDVSALLKRYANITVDDLNSISGAPGSTDRIVYLEEYGAFYNTASDFGPGYFQCTAGERTGDTIRLWSDTYELTIRAADGGYYIQSFQFR